MKHSMQLAYSIERRQYAQEHVLRILIGMASLRDWSLGLCLLHFQLLNEVTFYNDQSSQRLRIKWAEKSRLAQGEAAMVLEFESMEAWIPCSSFEAAMYCYLRYFRDGAAEVDHLDIDTMNVVPATRDRSPSITSVMFVAENAIPSITPEEARRRLEME